MRVPPCLFLSRLRVPVCTVAAIFGCSLGAARAQSILTLDNPATVSVAPGGTFTFTLEVSSNDVSLTGLDYNLSASGAGLFEITARDLTGSAFNDPITAGNVLFLNGAALPLSPGESNDLGAFSTATQTAPLNGVYVATYTVRTLTTAGLGSYRLTTANESASDDQFNTVALAGTSLAINVVPEPQTSRLLWVGAAVLVFLAYRRFAVPTVQ